MKAWWRDIRYRLGAWMLGDTWHIPRRTGADAAYLVLDTVGATVTFPVKELKLDVELAVPALGDSTPGYATAKRTGTFSGKIEDEL